MNDIEVLVLQVDGMDCIHCEQRITRALTRLAGVIQASADHHRGTVQVTVGAARAAAAVVERIEQSGFRVVRTSRPDEEI